ncbi:MAG: UbiX family flavin prenyltransferase [Bacteroidetes bacterium]|nr:UbiX family flavin prenyltransferase [Bacteroidota bacterium]
MQIKNKIVVAITGASGSIYAKLLLEKLILLSKSDKSIELAVVMSKNAKDVWLHELNDASYKNLAIKIFENQDFTAPFASGSGGFTTLVICPCSMGTMGRIANGISNDLISRSADVVLKERRKLILVTRDTPLNLIHINNMKVLTEAGAIVCPACPSFYSMPATIEALALTVVDRVIDLIGLPQSTFRWGNKS